MKKLLVIVLAVFFANAALFAEGWQVNAGIHLSKLTVSDEDNDYREQESNTPISIAIAKEFKKTESGDWLLELSLMTGEKYEEKYLGYSISAAFEIKMKTAFFASLYYQFNTSIAALKPYAGLGLGAASLKVSDVASASGSPFVNGSASGTNFAYQLAIGANYFFNENIAAGLGYGYRYYGSIEIDWDSNDKQIIDVDSRGLFAKVTYRF
ncbi:MAG: porin family protein [Helicobacteraceae bacterium]|jgi:opacity protein-like surface antigen|nr:porin family protein [Helicobacteraceae bacterium]